MQIYRSSPFWQSGARLAWAVVALTLSSPVHPATAVDSRQAIAWREDLSFLAREAVDQHPDLFHQVSEEAWQEELDRLSARLPELAPHELPYDDFPTEP